MVEKRFYVNKYPLSNVVKAGPLPEGSIKVGNEYEDLPAGTIFTIKSINGDFFELEPVEQIVGLTIIPMFSVAMLEKGFKNNQYIEN
jgi:hypothetical protein